MKATTLTKELVNSQQIPSWSIFNQCMNRIICRIICRIHKTDKIKRSNIFLLKFLRYYCLIITNIFSNLNFHFKNQKINYCRKSIRLMHILQNLEIKKNSIVRLTTVIDRLLTRIYSEKMVPRLFKHTYKFNYKNHIKS